ncbi:hypothetical protein QBC42DRAFT_314612, partial [Cladorrhinum samala]
SASRTRSYVRTRSPKPKVSGDAQHPLRGKPEVSSPCSPRKNIASSMTSFINRLRPSKRPEKGRTARAIAPTDCSGEDYQAGGARTASGSYPQRIGSVSRHNPDALPSSVWRTPISLPHRAYSTRGRNDQGIMLSTPQLIPRKEVPDLARVESPERHRGAYGRAPSYQKTAEDDEDPLLPRRPSQVVTKPPSYTREISATKQELRRQRRCLKESGDFLGVTGINPYTGQMDIITPTTSSEDATPASTSCLATLAHTAQNAAESYENAKWEAWPKVEHSRAERRKDEIRTILEQHGGNVMWRMKESGWSSVATPKLSPIAQSQQSESIRDMYSEATVQRSPSNPSPDMSPFLEMPAGAMRMEDQRPALLGEDVAMLAIPDQQSGSSVLSNIKENGGPQAKRSPFSKPRTIRFSLPPLVPKRLGPGPQESLPYRDGQLGPQPQTAPPAKGHRYRHSLPNMKSLQRITGGSVLELENLNPADQWASRLMQDLGCSESSDQSNSTIARSVRTASSTTGEEDMISGQSVFTPITITTGSECGQDHHLLLDGCGEKAERFNDPLRTPLSMSTPTTVFSHHTSSLSVEETTSSVFLDTSDSPTELQLSIWPSVESLAPQSTVTSTQEMAVSPGENIRRPLSPQPEQDSVTTSPQMRQGIETTEGEAATKCFQAASTGSQPTEWSMRKTMRRKAEDDEEEEAGPPSRATTAVNSSPTSASPHQLPFRIPNPSPKKPIVDLDHAIARGAARTAFTHLTTTTQTESHGNQLSAIIPLKEPTPTSIPWHRTVPATAAPVSDRESPRGAGPEQGDQQIRRRHRDLASLVLASGGPSRLGWKVVLFRKLFETVCKWVRVVLDFAWEVAKAYWDLVKPVFDGESEVRKRFEMGVEELQGEDFGIGIMTLVFIFCALVIGVRTVRGVIYVVWVVWRVGQGLKRVLGV